MSGDVSGQKLEGLKTAEEPEAPELVVLGCLRTEAPDIWTHQVWPHRESVDQLYSQLLCLSGWEAKSCCFEERPEGW